MGDVVRLLLMRHAQTPSNMGHLLDTSVPGPDLTALGRQQARDVADLLAGEAIDAVFASSLLRTQLTAQPLLDRLGLELRVRPGLREISAGDFEMRGDPEAVGAYLEAILAWSRGDLDQRVAGGESGHEVIARFDEVVREVVDAGHRTSVLVSHGAMIGIWVAVRARRSATTDDAAAVGVPLNTSVVCVEGDIDAGWSVTGHLGGWQTWREAADGSVFAVASPPGPAAPAGSPLGRTGEF